MKKLVTNPDEKQWGMFTHLAALATFVIPLGNIVGPLIIYMIKKDEYEFVADQGKEVLNFQITWTIIFFISAILILAVIGIFMLIGFGIAWLILVIIGVSKANQGEYYRYPLTIRFIN
ncbi:MAG: DUF4870 domain-containing protein [Mariniphaga sp.]|nr:DUF4870 domain-containing protein [Mariniphaga sp.]